MLCCVPNRAHRRHHWLVVTSAFLLAAGATVAATRHESGSVAGAGVSAGATASAKPTGSSGTKLQFGLDYSDTLTFASTSTMNTSLADAVHMGAQYIRVDLAWEDYQSTSANFAPDFARFDRVVDAASAHGLKVLATIDLPPVWARESGCSDTPACPPASDAAFADFAAEAAARYAPRGLHDWEVWNEPNISAWDPRPDPSAYAALLTATSKAIHNVDSQAYVMMGGLAAQQAHPGTPYISAADFIADVGKAGGLADAQAVAYHPYPGQSNAAASATIEAIDGSPDNMVAALSKAGYPKMPIWITETGAGVPGVLKGSTSAAEIAKEEQQQAQTATSLVQTLARTPNVAAMFWFDDQDQISARLVYGLRTASGTVRPALAALAKAIAANRK